jgi:His-Xaa-Ser system radical SAM maturase HxsB
MPRLAFHTKHHYQSHTSGYDFLPFQFMRWHDRSVLLTNDVGEFTFLDGADFDAFTAGLLSPDSPSYRTLKAKHFLSNSQSTVAIDLLATKYRTKHQYLDGFTRLHLFVVTLRCDHTCPYCQVSRVTQDRMRYDMSQDTAARSIELMFRSPAPVLKVEFQGGEPLLNVELIRWIVAEVEQRNVVEKRQLEFVVATNLSQLTDEMLTFFAGHSVCLSTSLDGPEFLHNANRPRPGNDSHQLTVAKIDRARKVLGHDKVSALMTTTASSLKHPAAIIDEYVRLGFDSIFLRPISPYGFAVRTRQAFQYQTDDFLAFYKIALRHIIDRNRAGTPIVEVYAQIVLQKILTPFSTGYVDLQSPAGAGIGVAVYNYDGDVYASDEGRMLAEMGDTSFRLGNVHRDDYEAIFGGATLRAIVEGSCVETLPGCVECAFAPYCGADPIFHWTTQGDPIGHRPTSAFCARNMGIIIHLFDLLRGGDTFTRNLLTAWATSQPTAEACPA